MTPQLPPGYILVAESDKNDKDMQIATMKAQIATLEASAKKANEDKEKLEATLKAMSVFNQGNGENNINKIANTLPEPVTLVKEQAAQIATLSAMVTKPMIDQMLTARRNAGNTDEEIKAEETRLTAMTCDQIVDDYKRNKIFIDNALQASDNSEEYFTKQTEKSMPFNGISNSPLVGKTFSLDSITNEVIPQ